MEVQVQKISCPKALTIPKYKLSDITWIKAYTEDGHIVPALVADDYKKLGENMKYIEADIKAKNSALLHYENCIEEFDNGNK